jgi:Ca2+-transporting ATPase
MVRMARQNALVNKLSAVETLGSTNIICTDKTGTLTENQMTVTTVHTPGQEIEVTGLGMEQDGGFFRNDQKLDPVEAPILYRALEVGVLCNNASINAKQEAVGDPVDAALLVSGIKAGINRRELLAQMPESREVAFDPQTKMMATFHRQNGHFHVAVKGAPEAILRRCAHTAGDSQQAELGEEERQDWLERSQTMASDGLRVLALAAKATDEEDSNPYQDLTLLGLVGLLDPPREDVRSSIEACQQAGIQVVMVTGDHPETARRVAIAVGLADEADMSILTEQQMDDLNGQDRGRTLGANVIARVSPERKLDLIDAYQKAGAIVAMTGDGVNDAPALKKADIGIAMGKRGTQVAQEASDMVLQDDAFATIVEAISQGRTIFENIRRFVLYLLSANMSEVMTVFLAALINAPLPFRPLQLLYLNLVTDVFPALALGVGEGHGAIMKRAPRDPREPILNRRHWTSISLYGLLITLAVIAALILAIEWLDTSQREAVTISFLTLAFAQLWHVFNMRDRGTSIWQNQVTRNPYVWGAVALCAALIFAAAYLPVMSDVLGMVPPDLNGWLLVLGLSAMPLFTGQILKSTKLTRSILV